MGLSDITSDTCTSVFTPTPPPVQGCLTKTAQTLLLLGLFVKAETFYVVALCFDLKRTPPTHTNTHTTPTSSHLTLCKQCACLPCEWCHCRTAVGERLECYSLLTEAKDCGMKRLRKMFVHVYACGAWMEALLQHCHVKTFFWTDQL